jgi:hypothetical protein
MTMKVNALSCFNEYRHFRFDQRIMSRVLEQRLELKQRRFSEQTPLVKALIPEIEII